VGREINLLEIEPLETEDFGHTMMTIHSAIRNLKSLDLAELARSYGALLRIEENDIDGEMIYRE
jgi:hypothetical protein